MKKLRYTLLAMLIALQVGAAMSAAPAHARSRQRPGCLLVLRHPVGHGPRKREACRARSGPVSSAKSPAEGAVPGASDQAPGLGPIAPSGAPAVPLPAPSDPVEGVVDPVIPTEEAGSASEEESTLPEEVGSAPVPPTSQEPFRFFSPTSIWNTRPAPEAEVDPESTSVTSAFVTEISREITEGKGPGISTTSYGVPIYTVGAEQPTVSVQLVSTTPAPALQEAWNEVPLPEDALPSEGTDHTLVVWQPSSNRLWEFWRLAKSTEGWQASWGGAMENVSEGPGVYGPSVWRNSRSWWGSSASSLSIVGGLITLEDLERGQIDHALAMAVPEIRAGVFSLPAQRTDGRSARPSALPEGAHLRIDPTLDLAEIPMPPLTRMIAEAAQKYGIFVRDGASVAHFFAQDPATLPSNPYLGPRGFFGGLTPGQLLASFPWADLQLLKMETRLQR